MQGPLYVHTVIIELSIMTITFLGTPPVVPNRYRCTRFIFQPGFRLLQQTIWRVIFPLMSYSTSERPMCIW